MFDDTTSEALAVQYRALRSIGMAGRIAMTFELSDNMRSMVADGVRYRHPQWDERAVEREVLRLMIGDDLFREAFGKDQPHSGRISLIDDPSHKGVGMVRVQGSGVWENVD